MGWLRSLSFSAMAAAGEANRGRSEGGIRGGAGTLGAAAAAAAGGMDFYRGREGKGSGGGGGGGFLFWFFWGLRDGRGGASSFLVVWGCGESTRCSACCPPFFTLPPSTTPYSYFTSIHSNTTSCLFVSFLIFMIYIYTPRVVYF